MASGCRCMRSGSTGESSSGRRRRGRRVDLAGADGLHAGRNRLEESATDMAAQKRWLSATTEAPAKRRKTWDHTLFRAPQITRTVILCVAWIPLLSRFPRTSLIAERARRLDVAAELAVAQAKASEDMA